MDAKEILLPSPAGEDQPLSSLTAEQVFHEYGPRVYNMARKMVSNESDAEDVTQDVFMQVVRSLPTFRGESAFPTWLHRVTVNAALAHRRRRALREAASVNDSIDQVLEGDVIDRPDERLLDQEQRLLIKQAVETLPDMYREVLVLSDFEGLSNADIAQELDITLPAVKSRLHRARLLLKDRLAPHFEAIL